MPGCRPSFIVGAVCLVVAVQWLAAAPARGAGGVWGAGGYPYVDGLVCNASGLTSPLASWDFGTGGPAFLTAPVRSNGQRDNAVPPFASLGHQTTVSVAPGRDGFASAADIATYAALLSRFGDTGTSHVAEIATAVMTKAGAADVPTCAPRGDLDTLLEQAATLAGPYKMTVTPQVTPALLGKADTIRVQVGSARGYAVPGLLVSIVGANVGLRTSAVTDAAGQVTARITVPAGTPATQVTITASVSAPVGLDEVSVATTPSTTNPNGTAVSAIYLAAPVTATTTVRVPIDTTASPVVEASASDRALLLGEGFTPQATVSGLRGHTAGLAFTVYGPISPAAAGRCDPGRFSAATPVAATTTTVSVTDNQPATASTWTPTRPGCYLVHATLHTTNATPPASADSGYSDPTALVQVSAATAGLTLVHTVDGRGPLSATLTPARTGGLAGTVNARLIGPVTPSASGSCAGLDYTGVDTVAVSATDTAGDGLAQLRSDPVSAAGCYKWQAKLVLTLPGIATLSVPAPARTVLVLTPSVAATSDQVSVVSPHAITTHVAVTGTYHQPAEVRMRMMHVASPFTGCQNADWAGATAVATGPPVAVRGDTGALAVASGPTPQLGCYQPVPTLVIDANPAVAVTGSLDQPYDVLLAGIDMAPEADPGVPHSRAVSLRPVYVTGIVVGAVEVAVIGVIVYLAWRSRRAPIT